MGLLEKTTDFLLKKLPKRLSVSVSVGVLAIAAMIFTLKLYHEAELRDVIEMNYFLLCASCVLLLWGAVALTLYGVSRWLILLGAALILLSVFGFSKTYDVWDYEYNSLGFFEKRSWIIKPGPNSTYSVESRLLAGTKTGEHPIGIGFYVKRSECPKTQLKAVRPIPKGEAIFRPEEIGSQSLYEREWILRDFKRPDELNIELLLTPTEGKELTVCFEQHFWRQP